MGKLKFTVIPQPSYNIDLSSTDWLFLKLKKNLKGECFTTDTEDQVAVRKGQRVEDLRLIVAKEWTSRFGLATDRGNKQAKEEIQSERVAALATQFTGNAYKKGAAVKSNTNLSHDTGCRTSMVKCDEGVQRHLTMCLHARSQSS
ncbi:hypothetical protein TNCV_3647181 [Trichonephila clavipes]|nr:hypothetical protein TNCV_3647181 [Trichonephila clavipes]